MSIAYYEEVTERVLGFVTASRIRPATLDEIKEATELHAQGKCPHTIIKDTKGWLYDYRTCVICGRGLGTV